MGYYLRTSKCDMEHNTEEAADPICLQSAPSLRAAFPVVSGAVEENALSVHYYATSYHNSKTGLLLSGTFTF